MSAFEVWFWLTDPLRGDSFTELAEPTRLHGLLMALAVGVLMPLAVLLARYSKILPGQDWPRELNRRFWWFSHLALVYGATVAVAAARPGENQRVLRRQRHRGELLRIEVG